MKRAVDIFPFIKRCVCGSKRFIIIQGFISGTVEVVCLECRRTAEYTNNSSYEIEEE